MTRAARKLLETFEQLPEAERQSVAVEILRRTVDDESAALDDADLIEAADQIFLELDRREGLD